MSRAGARAAVVPGEEAVPADAAPTDAVPAAQAQETR
jgi:hypothetical protein